MKKTLLALGILALSSCADQAQDDATQISYPETKKVEVSDSYFGTTIVDPYRWLEDDRSEETAQWVAAQNEVTFGYLHDIGLREGLKARLTEIWNYEKEGAPFTRGNYTYFYKNDGLQNQYVLWRAAEGQEPEVFLDPNNFSEDGTTSLSTVSFSEDGSLVAYSISEGGSDWRKIIVLDVETLEQIDETLIDVKFSGISWRGNDGFFYSSYDKPDGSELSAMTDQHKLYYHEMGTKQSEDQVIFGATPETKHRYVGASVSDDGSKLFISASVSTKGNKLYYVDLTQDSYTIVPVVEHTDADISVVDVQGSTVFVHTDLNAPNGRLARFDVSNPSVENWIDVIAETDNVLSVRTAGGSFFALYMVDALSKVEQYSMAGELIRTVELPGSGTASGFSARDIDEEVYFTFTNYNTPSTIFKMDIASGEVDVYRESAVDFDRSQYVSKQVFFTSEDGTRVPMMITHHQDITLDGTNPTILYGYGGFNVSLKPSFSVANAVWLEQGGVYAVPNLRGGGEYGKAWHDAGTQLNKQNVFDDFIAAAEYLAAEGYADAEHLAIRGGSNGGLLVGAVMTQRPDLMQVALPAVGVLDMLRYHTFTAGAGWAYDYGTAEQSEEMFNYLLGYSPVHNVEEGVSYPATLVTTGDHDDRVVPAHSFKFAAELQAKQAGQAPVMIRIETNAGHGAGTPVSKTIEQYADIFGFTLHNMGVEQLK